jgi:hypothetical protein
MGHSGSQKSGSLAGQAPVAILCALDNDTECLWLASNRRLWGSVEFDAIQRSMRGDHKHPHVFLSLLYPGPGHKHGKPPIDFFKMARVLLKKCK